MSHLQSSKGGEEKYILVYSKNTLLDDSEFFQQITNKVEPGVSGQLYTLLGDREKIFAPMRFHRFNVQCNSIFLHFMIHILSFRFLGFNIYLHDRW